MNIPDTLAKLTAQQAALGDGKDCRSDNERAAWYATYRAHADTISALMNAPDQLARAQARLTDVETRRAAHLAKQAEIEQVIVAFTDPASIRDGRERDREHARQQDLRRQLERLHEGSLLRAPGVTYESLAYLDTRIKELTERRDRAQCQLDGYLAQAEQLLAVSTVTS